MTRIAYWDCFSGISGDMALGALLDAGLDLDHLRTELNKLDLDGWEIASERDVRYGIAGTRAHVRVAPQTVHRHLSDIESILARSALGVRVRDRSLAVFRRLAEAEGAVHGMSPREVHFHEVGALDAIVDVVGVVAGLELLDVERVYASALPLGSGWIEAAHGRIPAPGPAVLSLLGAVAAPIQGDDRPFELVTPTGAALLAELATFQRPAFRLDRTGYGFGARDTGQLNAVRVWLGTDEDRVRSVPDVRLADTAADGTLEQIVLLETNVDDQPGEQLAFAAERLLVAGALDVWWQPIGMKKGRAAIMLTVLGRLEREAELVDVLMQETTSLGVRRQTLDRWTCDRELRTVTTEWGPIRIKLKRWRGAVLGAAPEYEDCAQLARAKGIALQTIYRAAERAAHDQL